MIDEVIGYGQVELYMFLEYQDVSREHDLLTWRNRQTRTSGRSNSSSCPC
jgi:hypothetical protein